MDITEVRIRKVEGKNKLKAYATVSFDNDFAVHNFKVIETPEGGLFIAMPSRLGPDGTFKDIAHPINQAFRTKLTTAILESYNKE